MTTAVIIPEDRGVTGENSGFARQHADTSSRVRRGRTTGHADDDLRNRHAHSEGQVPCTAT